MNLESYGKYVSLSITVNENGIIENDHDREEFERVVRDEIKRITIAINNYISVYKKDPPSLIEYLDKLESELNQQRQ